MNNLDAVGKTSLLTAAMRAAETKRSDAEGRLFSDPYAEVLAGAEGFAILQRALAESGDQPAIAVRTYYMDEKINAALKEGVRQIVILAAGMDSRAYRMSFPEGSKIFELDRKEVLDYKREKLANAKPQCGLRYIAVDLRDEWKEKLIEAGFKAKERTLWLVEGLLMYLEESDVTLLFNRISLLAKSKDILLCDVLGRSLLESPFMQKQLQFLASLGAPWKFGIHEPEDFFKKFGWDANPMQPGSVAPARWPFPVAPRNVPNVPRSFFVEARKL